MPPVEMETVGATGVAEFLARARDAILILHGLSAAIGVGAATVTDALFFKFLKDFRISKREAAALRAVSVVIWVALTLLILTGIGLWVPEAERLNRSPKFIAKTFIVGVIIVNGILLNLWIAPRLIRISFGVRHEHLPGELRRARRFAFALGAVSLTSWYSAFILGSLRSVALGAGELLGLYALIVGAAVGASQVIDWRLGRRGGQRDGRTTARR